MYPLSLILGSYILFKYGSKFSSNNSLRLLQIFLVCSLYLFSLSNNANIEKIIKKTKVIINSLEEIDGIGHRVVHGGDKYTDSVVVTDKVVEDIIRFIYENIGYVGLKSNGVIKENDDGQIKMESLLK